jgi:hypothetical protein
MTDRLRPRPEGGTVESEGTGWKSFAGVMLVIVGFLNIFDGLVAITQTRYVERNLTGGELPITNDVKQWGWVALIFGAIIVAAGIGVLGGATWARIVGVFVAGLNMVFQFAYLDHSPFWSFTMIVVDILVIYGLIAHGGRDQDYEVT